MSWNCSEYLRNVPAIVQRWPTLNVFDELTGNIAINGTQGGAD